MTIKQNGKREKSPGKNGDDNPQNIKSKNLSRTNNDQYEGYDEDKSKSSYQGDYDVDENAIDERRDEYKKFDESTSKD